MDENKKISHVATYVRISTEKRSENVETLANHREILNEYAKSNGYTYVEFGEVLSGGKSEIEDRPQLRKLLNEIEKYDAILCVELSRLSRNGLISQTVKQYCIDYDKPIITPFKTYDLANNENDRLMFDVGSMISSHEHGVIGKRSKMNKIQMAKAGLHVSGGVPYGYIRNSKTKKLEIDEEAAKIIRYIFKLHSQGLGSYKIRDILNAEGYKPARSNAFNLPSIKRIIKNPHYKGGTVFNDRKKIKKKGKFIYEIVDKIVVEDTHPAIIPPDEWDRANKDNQERAKQFIKTREKPAVKTEITMVKDLIYCGTCGRKLEVRKDHKSKTGYLIKTCPYMLKDTTKCPNIGIKLDAAIYSLMTILRDRKEHYKLLSSELELGNGIELRKENMDRINHLKKQLKEVDEQEKVLLDLAIKRLFSEDQLREKKQELLDSRDNITKTIEKLEREVEESNFEKNLEDMQDFIEIIEKLPNLDPEDANAGLKRFIKKIHYTRVVPEELKGVSTNNPQRRELGFELKVEYY